MKFYIFTSDQTTKHISICQFTGSCHNTVVLLCWDWSIKYFIEYAASLNLFSFLVTFKNDEMDKLIPFTSLQKDCFFVYPTNLQNDYIYTCALQLNCFLFNSEQMSIPDRRNKVEDFLKRGGRCINYNETNGLCINSLFSNQMLFLPYICQTTERQKLKSLNDKTEKKYDYAFVCSLTTRRREFVSRLTLAGVKLCVITDCFGIERDEQIAQCRALLNIHASEQYTIYESLRCDRWISAGMKVVCEQCSNNNVTVAYPDNLFFVETAKLFDFCVQFSEQTIVKNNENCKVLIHQTDNNNNETKSLEKFCNWTNKTEKLTVKHQLQNISQICFNYGADNLSIDVTDIANKIFQSGNNVWRVPACASFNALFGDVCPNTEKLLTIYLDEIRVTLNEQREFPLLIQQNNAQIILEKK